MNGLIIYFYFVKKGYNLGMHRLHLTIFVCLLHGPSMFAVKAKNYGVLYNQASSIAFAEISSYWSALKSS